MTVQPLCVLPGIDNGQAGGLEWGCVACGNGKSVGQGDGGNAGIGRFDTTAGCVFRAIPDTVPL